MEVQYSLEARQLLEFPLLEQASALISQFPKSQSSQVVQADWKCVKDVRGRTLYRLTIHDLAGEVSTDFTADEIRIPLHVRVRIYRLWGDLLEIRNNAQHLQVQIISGQIAASAEAG